MDYAQEEIGAAHMAGEPEVEIEEDDPIVIELSPDVDDDAVAKATAKEEAEPKPELDAGTKALTEQLEAAKQALALEATQRQEAEQRALEALQYAQQRERETWESSRRETQTHTDMLQTGLAGSQAEQVAAKQAYKAAFEAGDPDGMADANARIARAATTILEYERAAGALATQEENYRRQAQQQPRQPQQQRQPTAEEILSRNEMNPNLLPREKEWLRAHPDATLDQRKNTRLKVAFDDAVDKGIPRGSDAYFQHLDKFMEYEGNGGSKQSVGARVSAPVSRGSGGPAARPQTVKLTADDIAIANSFGFTSKEDLQAYARNKLNVPNRQKELNRTTN